MKTRIHPTRIIAYLVQYLLVAAAYWFLRSHFFLMLLIVMSVVPVISIVSVFILRHFLTTSKDVMPDGLFTKMTASIISLSIIATA